MKKSELTPENHAVLLTQCLDIEKEYKGAKGVLAVALSLKKKAGKYTDDFCFLFLVEEKKPAGSLPRDHLIPEKLGGLLTDVETIGTLKEPEAAGETIRQADNELAQVLEGGMSVGIDGGYIGTMGGVFNWTNPLGGDATHVLLSNHHVLFDAASGVGVGSEVGSPNYSKGSKCCCVCCDDLRVATIVNGLYGGALDCAIAEINLQGATGIRLVPEDDFVETIEDPMMCDDVKKYGAASFLTKGFVSAVNYAIRGDGGVILTDLLRITGWDYASDYYSTWGLSGDSGALVMRLDRGALIHPHIAHGLHMGVVDGDTTDGVACKMTHVAADLAITPFADLATDTAPQARARPTPRAGWDGFKKRLRASPLGGDYVVSVDAHTDEIAHLVNTSATVASAWHKNKGPDFLVENTGAAEDIDKPLKPNVDGVSADQLIKAMSEALSKKGSSGLQSAIARYLPHIPEYKDCGTVRASLLRVVLLSLKDIVFDGANAYFPDIAKKGCKNPKIPPIDPLHLPKVEAHKKGGSWPFKWTAHITVEKSTVTGASSFKIGNPGLDAAEERVKFKLKSGHIVATGDFGVTGKVSGIGYRASGQYRMTFSSIETDVQSLLDTSPSVPRVNKLNLKVVLKNPDLEVKGLSWIALAVVNVVKGYFIGPITDKASAEVQRQLETQLPVFINDLIKQTWPKP